MRNFTIAAACVRSVVGDRKSNLASMARMAEEGARQGADLILFPEACLTGYAIGSGASASAMAIDEPELAQAARLAGRVGIDMSVGMMERTEHGSLHLTQVLITREGTTAGIYRKTHLGPTEQKRFTAGGGNGIADLGYAKLGQQLCFDAHFPELSLIQADKGAELILAAHASPKKEPPRQKLARWLRYLAARAYDNTVYVAACNPVGDNGQGWSFAGTALILGPKGEILSSYAGDEPGLALARLEAGALERIVASRMGHFRANRRPGLYRRLIEES